MGQLNALQLPSLVNGIGRLDVVQLKPKVIVLRRKHVALTFNVFNELLLARAQTKSDPDFVRHYFQLRMKPLDSH